jgi:hypothetical protein
MENIIYFFGLNNYDQNKKSTSMVAGNSRKQLLGYQQKVWFPEFPKAIERILHRPNIF